MVLRQYMQYHEYMAETTDFLDWIAEKHQLASSQDIGQVCLLACFAMNLGF